MPSTYFPDGLETGVGAGVDVGDETETVGSGDDPAGLWLAEAGANAMTVAAGEEDAGVLEEADKETSAGPVK